jgi:hypothetical protein
MASSPSNLFLLTSGAPNVQLAGGAQRDAFGRLRTGQPVEVFSAACTFDASPLFYENALTGTAAATYNQDLASVVLSVPAPGDVALRQSRPYVRYRPGKSQQIFITGNFGGNVSGFAALMGYGDDNDGFFVGYRGGSGVGTGWGILYRTSTSGAPVDTPVLQANWNLDRLDGTGPSGITLDPAKQQLVTIDFGWLGIDAVRIGFVFGNQIVYCHQFDFANLIDVPYMQRGSLPIRWRCQNVSGAGTMLATCSSVQSEGGFNTLGVLRATSRGNSSVSLNFTTGSTALVPILTIRLASGYTRASLEAVNFDVFAVGNATFEIQILVNATLTKTVPPLTWSSSSEATEKNLDADALSGGQVLASTYAFASATGNRNSATGADLFSDVPICSNIAGVADTLTVAVRPLSGGATTYYASLSWQEFTA